MDKNSKCIERRSTSTAFLTTRRQSIETVLMTILLTPYTNTTKPAQAYDPYYAKRTQESGYFGGLSDDVVSSLRYQNILGKGSFKSVYGVFTKNCDHNDATDTCDGRKIDKTSKVTYAMAVERLTSKAEARDEIRGIKIAEYIQRELSQSPSNHGGIHSDDGKFFEAIEGWWIQSTPLVEYEKDQVIFSSTNVIDRTRKRPTSFIGNRKWILVSFKPIYNMDLKTFINKCPRMYAVNDCEISKWSNTQNNSSQQEIVEVGGISLTEHGAYKLVYELCHAGGILNELGIIHRDIKPKNIMLMSSTSSTGHPVIIDFGFADFGATVVDNDNRKHICVTEPGLIKGEVNYTLAQDVKLYRGCDRGDMFAFGRTIFEVIFGSSELQQMNSGKRKITVEAVTEENQAFRERVEAKKSANTSRFLLSREAYESILYVVESLCRENNPLSFQEVETYIKSKI